MIRKGTGEQDFKKIVELWFEIGWLKSKGLEDNSGLKDMLKSSDCWVYEENGKIEATAFGIPGEINYLNEKLSFHGLSGVVVSPVARKEGLASRLVTQSITESYHQGTAVSGLLMFEQGYYNYLGYGTGSYDHVFTFDPSYLNVDLNPDRPSRISKDDWKEVHRALLNRKPYHGAVSLLPARISKDKLAWSDQAYGLGYYNEDGELTHFLWLDRDKGSSHGPLRVEFMAFENHKQFLELLAVLKNLSDQIYAVRMKEPADIQLQDYIKYPRKQNKRSDSKFGYNSRVFADWQIRILNLEKAIGASRFTGSPLKFNLELYDPLERYLEGSDWQGLSGNYQLELGEQSLIKDVRNSELPTLRADINSFSRLWLGVLKPSVLALNQELSAPKELLDDLDRKFVTIPKPSMEWEF